MVTRKTIEALRLFAAHRKVQPADERDLLALCDLAEVALDAREALEKALRVVDYAASEESAIRSLLQLLPAQEDA